MALNYLVGNVTQPGATGQQVVSIPAAFDPKALILIATPNPTSGTAAIHASLGTGFATYRGSVVQQRYASGFSEDALADSDTYYSYGSNSLIRLLDGTGATDLEIDFISFASDSFTIDWVNLHTTASITVSYIVFGGSDITDALVGDFTMGTTDTTDDVTVVASFGQPDLVFFECCGGAFAATATGFTHSLGFAKKGEDGRCLVATSQDAAATGTVSHGSFNNRAFYARFNTTVQAIGRLDTTVANWPTDGFRVLYTANPTVANPICFLALKGSFTTTTGEAVFPNSGTPPVVQNLAHGSPPKGAFLLDYRYDNGGAANFVETTLDAMTVGIGAGDGTNEQWRGVQDDSDATTINANSHWSSAKVLRSHNQSQTLRGEADGLISGDNFQVSVNDVDTIQHPYQWLVLGDSVAAAFVPRITTYVS